MAKQTGLVRYSGTMGGVRHFKIKGLGGDFAGLTGGPTADQIANDEAFIRTRENMTEFGGSAKAAKSVRVGLSQIIKQMSDPRVTGRLTAIMKQINLEDTTSPRGQRSILVASNKDVLKGFDYDITTNLSGIFHAPYTLSNDGARQQSTFDVPSFNPANLINAPAGATHFRLVNAINVVSDWTYNTSTGDYDPTDPTLSELNAIEYSDYLDLNAVTPAFTLKPVLPGSPTMTASVSVLNNIGIEFYQQVSGNFYLFSSGNALKADDVF